MSTAESQYVENLTNVCTHTWAIVCSIACMRDALRCRFQTEKRLQARLCGSLACMCCAEKQCCSISQVHVGHRSAATTMWKPKQQTKADALTTKRSVCVLQAALLNAAARALEWLPCNTLPVSALDRMLQGNMH